MSGQLPASALGNYLPGGGGAISKYALPIPAPWDNIAILHFCDCLLRASSSPVEPVRMLVLHIPVGWLVGESSGRSTVHHYWLQECLCQRSYTSTLLLTLSVVLIPQIFFLCMQFLLEPKASSTDHPLLMQYYFQKFYPERPNNIRGFKILTFLWLSLFSRLGVNPHFWIHTQKKRPLGQQQYLM